MVIFKFEMRNHRKYIWGWALSLAVCIFLMIPVYYSLLGRAESTTNPLYDMLGETDFFQSIGVSMEYLTSPLGIYSFLASFFMLAAGIFGMNFGISIHIKEFSGKTSKYLFAKPHTRKVIFYAKAITVLCGSAIVRLTFMFSSFLSLSLFHTGFNLGEFILISNSLLLVSLLLAALGILIGVIFSNNHTPLLTAGLVVFSEYCISSFSRIVGNKGISFLSPYSYFSAADISHIGFYEWDYLVCYFTLLIMFMLIAYNVFLRKDVQFRS